MRIVAVSVALPNLAVLALNQQFALQSASRVPGHVDSLTSGFKCAGLITTVVAGRGNLGARLPGYRSVSLERRFGHDKAMSMSCAHSWTLALSRTQDSRQRFAGPASRGWSRPDRTVA